MTFAVLKQTVYNWVVHNSKLPDGRIIFDEQGAPRPQRPYATIKVAWPGVKLGATDDQRMSGRVLSVNGMREVTIALNVLGADAFETLSLLRDSLELPSTVEIFTVKDLAVVEASEIRDLSELEENQWMLRAQMDVTVRYNVSQKDVGLSTIEGVGLSGTRTAPYSVP